MDALDAGREIKALNSWKSLSSSSTHYGAGICPKARFQPIHNFQAHAVPLRTLQEEALCHVPARTSKNHLQCR